MHTVKWIDYEMFTKYCGYNKHIIETFPDEVDTLNNTLREQGTMILYDYSKRKELYEFLDYIDGPNIEIVPTSKYAGRIVIHYENSEV